MSAEKVAAFYESWNAMLLQSFRASLDIAWSSSRLVWFPWLVSSSRSRATSLQLHRAALAVLGQGIAPIHRRAVANAKRLRRIRM